jgi:hypothetical protein
MQLQGTEVSLLYNTIEIKQKKPVFATTVLKKMSKFSLNRPKSWVNLSLDRPIIALDCDPDYYQAFLFTQSTFII